MRNIAIDRASPLMLWLFCTASSMIERISSKVDPVSLADLLYPVNIGMIPDSDFYRFILR
jgi:hypothetical protein